MFYDEAQAILACEEDPSLIFEAIKEEHFDLVDKLLSKGKVDINVCDELGSNVMFKLLRRGQFDLVLKHMKNKNWDVNHQNNEGNTFAHILVTMNYISVREILCQLISNKKFIPNIKNNRGETILDKSINDSYFYTTVKILEDKRFNNIDIMSFKNLYNSYIKTNRYGKYTKLANLEIIMDSLEKKKLPPRMNTLVSYLKENFESIKEEAFNNKMNKIDHFINKILLESNV